MPYVRSLDLFILQLQFCTFWLTSFHFPLLCIPGNHLSYSFCSCILGSFRFHIIGEILTGQKTRMNIYLGIRLLGCHLRLTDWLHILGNIANLWLGFFIYKIRLLGLMISVVLCSFQNVWIFLKIEISVYKLKSIYYFRSLVCILKCNLGNLSWLFWIWNSHFSYMRV